MLLREGMRMLCSWTDERSHVTNLSALLPCMLFLLDVLDAFRSR